MKWFKHMTDMLDDVFIDGLVNEFGPAGYGIWCGILETYAKYAKKNCGDFVEIPWSSLTNRLRTSAAKLQRLLNYSETKRKLSQRGNATCLEIAIPKMTELRDEWRSRKQKDSGVTRELLGSSIKEERIKNKKIDKKKKNSGLGADAPTPPPRNSKTFLSDTWEPSRALLDWANEKHPAVITERETVKFKNYFIGEGKKKVNWDRTWQNWIARADEWTKKPTETTQTNPRWDVLRRYTLIRCIHEPDIVIPVSEVELRPSEPNRFWWRHKPYAVVDYEGVPDGKDG